jgi:hypothetical protein
MDDILWHRRETRRQTEKTNLVLQHGSPSPTRHPMFPTDPMFPHSVTDVVREGLRRRGESIYSHTKPQRHKDFVLFLCGFVPLCEHIHSGSFASAYANDSSTVVLSLSSIFVMRLPPSYENTLSSPFG